jgi:hypothetical protein
MKKIFILHLLWLIISHSSYCQGVIKFNKTYPYLPGGNSRGAMSVLTKDTFVFVIGIGDLINFTRNGIYFNKISLNGTSNIEKVIQKDSTQYYIGLCNAAVFSTDSTIIAVGGKVKYIASIQHSDMLIVKFNLHGDTLWLKSYGDTSLYENLSSIQQLSNGDIMAVGEKVNASNNVDYLLVKFDSTGNLLWAKNWGGATNDYLNQISLAADGNLILGGQFTEWDAVASAYRTRSSIFKTDTSGNIIWHHDYRKTYDLFGAYILSYADSTTIAGCMYDTFTNNPYPAHYKNYFIKFDKFGNEVWKKLQLDMIWNHMISPPVLLANGDFIICSSTEDTITQEQIGAISKFDRNGNQKWFRPIYHNPVGFAYFYAGAVATDGSIFAAGSAQSMAIPTKQEMWLVHVDSMGCLLDSCWLYDGISSEQLTVKNEQLKLWPNPAHNKLLVLSDGLLVELVVYDVYGRIMNPPLQSSNQQIELDISNLASGIYFIKAIHHGGQVSKKGSPRLIKTAKFVKE